MISPLSPPFRDALHVLLAAGELSPLLVLLPPLLPGSSALCSSRFSTDSLLFFLLLDKMPAQSSSALLSCT